MPTGHGPMIIAASQRSFNTTITEASWYSRRLTCETCHAKTRTLYEFSHRAMTTPITPRFCEDCAVGWLVQQNKPL